MLSRTKQLLRETEEQMAENAEAAQAIIDAATAEKRDRTQDENDEIAGYTKAIGTLRENRKELQDQLDTEKRVEDAIEAAGGLRDKEIPDAQPGLANVQVTSQAKSLGELFVESKGYQDLQEEFHGKGITREFSSGLFEADFRTKAGTLLEGAQGSGLIPVPQVIPGTTEKLFQRLTVADLLASGSTSTSSLRYVVEGTATSGAAGVAEGGTKPASDLTLSTVDEPVKKIATILSTSDEMLEDAAQVQSYINGRLSLFVRIEEERQLLLGGGTNDLVGITGRSGVTTWGRGTVDNNAVAVFKALNGNRGSSLLEPDGIIMNPANWQTTRLLTDSAGQFFGGGPFQGPYGSGSNIGASGQVTGADDSLWNKPVVVTTAIGAGTALVGSFGMGAQVFRRGGLTVEATNSHDDYFTKNLVAIRAEERLALAVYRPAAFTLITGLN